MSLDRRTPVLVGAGTLTQRGTEGATPLEAVGLMASAAEMAADDAGSRALLTAAGRILVPKGSWSYHDPAALLGAAIGNDRATTTLADLGVLQTTLFERAASDIAAGRLDVAIVAGGEARWREVVAAKRGESAPSTDDRGAEPAEVLRPRHPIISSEEIAAGLTSAVSHYALIENARRVADGQSPAEHRRVIDELWVRFAAVAASSSAAWNRRPVSPADLAPDAPGNRLLASPYHKWHVSQWNVDQAAALILCSVEAARAHGVPSDRWVFPHAIAESNVMIPVSRRSEVHRCPGFAVAGRAALALAGVTAEDVAHVDLYSCFPIAVRVQAAEIGLDPGRQLTVTGGMTFGGGPLNNYVLQSTAAMVGVLRADPTSRGMLTAVSGMLTKQGVGIWSAEPPADGYRTAEVSDEVAAATDVVEVIPAPAAQEPATITTSTVLADAGPPLRAVIVATHRDGRRSLAASEDEATAQAMLDDGRIGEPVTLQPGGGFRLL